MAAKGAFVKDLTEGAAVQAAFMVARKSVPVARNGKPYLNLTLADRTGEIDCRVWDVPEALARAFDEGDVVVVRGKASAYQGRLQVVAQDVTRADPAAFHPGEFLATSAFGPDAMEAEVRRAVASVRSEPLRELLLAFLDDPEIAQGLRRAPAAKAIHHCYVGGLIEHVCSMMRAALALHSHYDAYYPGLLDRDLLVAGVLLHDIGKTRELEYSTSFGYTDEGHLLGHLVQGVEMITAKAAAVGGFPEALLLKVKHLVVSHHGRLEFGSPKRPKIAEALLLHYVDEMDTRMNVLHTFFLSQRGGGQWTQYHRELDRYLLNPYAGQDMPDQGEGRQGAPGVAAAPAAPEPRAPEPTPARAPRGQKPPAAVAPDLFGLSGAGDD